MAKQARSEDQLVSEYSESETYRREVAHEGLEGITLASLWIRLQEVFLHHNKETRDVHDAAFQQAVWEHLLADAELSFYILPEPRSNIPPLEYRRIEDFTYFDVPETATILSVSKRPFSAVDSEEEELDISTKASTSDPSGCEVGHFSYSWEAKEIEPSFLNWYGIFVEKQPKVFGSCRHLHSREDVSSTLRESKPSLEAAREQFGDRLVIVASEQVRKNELGLGRLSPADVKKISHHTYAVLEVIARHRHYGQFLVLGGWTFLGRGHQAIKQLHNCTKILKHLGLITKKTCRFDIPTSHSAYQYLTYTLLTAFDRVISTRSQNWVLRVRDLLLNSPAPGYPAILLPRLEAYQHDPCEKSIRKRIKRLFMDLRSETVQKPDLIGQFPQLDKEQRNEIMVLYADREAEENRPEPVKIEPYTVPGDLKIDQKSPKGQLSLAIFSILKANRDRGLSGPEISAVLMMQGCRKKLSEKALKQCLSMGYVIRSGHFNVRNKPKRYVLVSSEEERQQVLARLAADVNDEDFPDEPPSDKSIEITSLIIHDSSSQALKRKLSQIAEKMQCFPDGSYFIRLARFFDSTIQTVPSVDFYAWLQEEIDKGSLAPQIIITNNPGFQMVVSGLESVEEQSVLIVHSSADREQIVRNYAKRLTFENILRSVLGPYKEVKGILELCRVEPGKFSCHDIFNRDRITRIRLLHRYLIQLAHQRSDADSVTQRPQWAHKVERFEFCGQYPGWVTMEEIVRQMPLAVFVRLVPLLIPEDVDKKYIYSNVEDPDIFFLPLYMQDLRMLSHTMESRHFVYVLRDLLGLLQCFGFIREGPCDALYPDGTELFYVADHIVVPDTNNIPLSRLCNGVLKEEAFAGLVEMKFEFNCDKNVMEFWQAMQKHALTVDWSRGKSETDSVTMDRLRVYELKQRFGQAVMQACPDEIPTVFRPPGDHRSIFGFDSILNLNERKTWKRRILAAYNMRRLPAYVPDLDDVPHSQANISLYRGEEIPAPTYSRLKVVTGGKKAKPGPKYIKKPVKKSPLRASATEIHRLFQPHNWGSLFHNVRPWCRGEELVAVVYLAIRDLIVRFKRKPIHTDMLVDLLENYFPDAAFRRSVMECEVLVLRMGRLPKILHEMRIVQNMARRMINLEAFLDFVNQNKKFPLSMRELWQAWQEVVEQVVNKILQAPSFPRRMLLNTKADIRSVVGSSDAAKQFALENLVMQALHTESAIDPAMLEVLSKQSDRTMVGMATYLSYRGILAHRKGISNKQTPHLLITVGTKGMGLSMRFKEKYRLAQDTVVAFCVSPSACVGFCEEDGSSSQTMIPFYFQPIMEYFARNCQYDRTQLNDAFQLTDLGSNFWARAQQTIVEEDHHPDIKYRPRFRVTGADIALQQMINQARSDIGSRFAIWKAEQEREVVLPRTEDNLHTILKENFAGNDFRLVVLISKELKAGSHSGLTKKDLFQLMDVKFETPVTDVHLLLNRLVKLNCAVEAGCDVVSYVSALHAAPWVQARLTSSALGVFLPRPWSKLDGSVDGVIVVKYLRWILQFICEQHFINLGAVITQFHPYLLGRTVIEILKILHALALIKKSRRVPNPSFRYLDINSDNQWMDDDSLDDIFVGCHTSVFDSLMGIAALEERFGLQRDVVFPDVTEADSMDIGDDADDTEENIVQLDEPVFSEDLDKNLDEGPSSQESLIVSTEEDDESSLDELSEDETDDVNDDQAAFMDSIGLPGSQLLLGEGDDLDSSFLDADSDEDEVGVGMGKPEVEDMEED